MKKRILATLIILSISVLTACSSGVPQAEYDEILSEKEAIEKELDDLKSEKESIEKELDDIKKEYSEYKEEMKPYAELSEAEAEQARLEAEQRVAEIKAEEEAKKAEEEAAKKAEEEAAAAAKAEEEAKGYETGITYDQLARTPDDYEGQKVKFYGRVVQVMEGDGEVAIRLAVNDNYDNILYCEYDASIVSSRVLEDDKITIYGVSYGLYTYESTMGGAITIPAVVIDKIDQ